jgi:peptidoglycan/LPS O-acetylase OafA/YrhL
VLIVTIAIGWWGLLPADFRQLGVHILGGAAFVSNLVLWNETGYFDTSAELKPLLHLWSLGVEEQYYLIWPIALWFFRRHLPRVLWLIVAAALGSFVLNIFATSRYPDVAFYWPMPRFWELMIGSIIAYLQTVDSGGTVPAAVTSNSVRIRAHSLSTAGLICLGATLVLLNQQRAFPGWWAILPTAGAALVICAGPQGWFNRYILSSRPAVAIGLISYPLYLWHWPLLTYARIFNAGEPPDVPVRLGALALTGVLAWATYEFVEKSLRHNKHARWSQRVVPLLGGSMAVLGAYGIAISFTMAQSRSAAVPQLAAISEAFDDWEYGGDRLIRGDDPQVVLFIGDSHMQQYLPRVEKIMRQPERPVRSVMFRTHHGCAPLPGIERKGRGCDVFVDAAYKAAEREDVATIVIGASWIGFISRDDYFRSGDEFKGGSPLRFLTPETQWVLDDFEAQLQQLTDSGKRIAIVLSSPRGDAFDPRVMVKKEGWNFAVTVHPPVPKSEIMAQNAVIDRVLEDIAKRVGATLVNPLDALCMARECPTVDINGAPLFKDNSHLRTSVVVDRFDVLDRFVYADAAQANKTARSSAATEAR